MVRIKSLINIIFIIKLKLAERGAPRISYEFKTLQKPLSYVDQHHVHVIHDMVEAGQLDRARRAALKTVINCLQGADIFPRNTERDYDLSRFVQAILCGKSVPAFFLRTCMLYPTSDVKKLRTRYVTSRIYRHLGVTERYQNDHASVYDLQAASERVGRGGYNRVHARP